MEDNKVDEFVNEQESASDVVAIDKKQQVIKYVAIWLAVIALFLALNMVIRMVTAAKNPGYQANYYSGGQPVSNSPSGQAGAPGAAGNCGGTCCTQGTGGQAATGGQTSGQVPSTGNQATGSDSSDLEKLAIDWYVKTYGDSNVTAEVQDFGCHQQISIKKDGKVVKELSYQGGQLQVLK